MKAKVFLAYTILLLGLCAWTTEKNHEHLNANSWSVKIGNKEILSSSKNEMGDVTTVTKKSLKPADVLYAERYLCGQSTEGSITTLTIKNNSGQVIKESTHESFFSFSASMPLSDFLDKFTIGETISVCFTISDKDKASRQTVLLGRITLK